MRRMLQNLKKHTNDCSRQTQKPIVMLENTSLVGFFDHTLLRSGMCLYNIATRSVKLPTLNGIMDKGM